MNELFKTDQWYLLSTKPRLEKTACDNLYSQGHQIFLPTFAHANKTKPLFPGYLFVQPRLGASYVSIKSTRGVKQFIKFGNEFPLIPESLIEFLRTRLKNLETQAINQMKYQKGQIVYVQNETFKYFEAVFDSYDKENNVFILLKFLGETQRIKLKESDLN